MSVQDPMSFINTFSGTLLLQFSLLYPELEATSSVLEHSLKSISYAETYTLTTRPSAATATFVCYSS